MQALAPLLAQCQTEAEKFAVGLAYLAGVTTKPDRVDVFPTMLRVRKVGTNKSDTVYYLRNDAFLLMRQLWHKRWSPHPLLKQAKAAGAAWRRK